MDRLRQAMLSVHSQRPLPTLTNSRVPLRPQH
jgi:hypothetical protein